MFVYIYICVKYVNEFSLFFFSFLFCCFSFDACFIVIVFLTFTEMKHVFHLKKKKNHQNMRRNQKKCTAQTIFLSMYLSNMNMWIHRLVSYVLSAYVLFIYVLCRYADVLFFFFFFWCVLFCNFFLDMHGFVLTSKI